MSTQYRIKDIKLATLGRKKITIAEKEMPGLMELRHKYAKTKPLFKSLCPILFSCFSI